MIFKGLPGKSMVIRILVVAVLLVLVAVGISFLAGPETSSQPLYEVTHLAIEGMFWSVAEAMNDHGQLAGICGKVKDECHAFVWDEKTGITDLHLSKWTESRALDINNAGQVVGVFKESSDDCYLFFWDPVDGMTEIVNYDTPGILAAGYHVRLNNHGQVVGTAIFRQVVGASQTHAILWDRQDGIKDLGTGILHGKESYGWGINDSGQVVGGYNDGSGSKCVFISDDEGGIIELEKVSKEYYSVFEINNAGQVAGGLNNTSHVCLWDREDGTIDLTDLVAGEVGSDLVAERSFVRGLNESGEVVGKVLFNKSSRLLRFIRRRYIQRNFVFRSSGDMIILESQPGLGYSRFEVRDINNEGAILLIFMNKAGRYSHPAILTPICDEVVGESK